MSESAEGAPPGLAAPRIGSILNRDERLAQRAARGDERAFEALFRRYHQPLYRYCRAIVTSPEDAEDALQATMVKALRALPGEQREIAIKPWLYRVAHNESISILRARRATDELDPAAHEAGATVEGTAEMRDRVRTLVGDLATLPERQRATLVMRELNDLSYDEIGAAVGISPAAARQSVYEARTALFAVAEGREMDCTTARETMSAGDRRKLRGRKLRAHLRGCEGCRDFQTAIADRRQDLAALAPPLAAPAALALLHAAVGGGSAATAGAGIGVAGAGFAGGTAIKAATAVLAAVAIGGGAVATTGVLERDGGGSPASRSSGSADEPAVPADATPTSPAGSTPPASAERGDGSAANTERRNGRGGGTGHSNHGAAGNSDSAPGQTGSAPGQSVSADAPASAPGHSSSAPGQTGTAPGQAHSNAGGGGAATAPGQTGSSPGGSESAPGQTSSSPVGTGTDGEPNGNAVGHATAPGQAEK
jgi:RNA polymerase sigma factor (sigma-70 family)